MSYVRIMTALTRLNQAKQTMAEVSRRMSAEMRSAKDEIDAGNKQIKMTEHQVSVFSNAAIAPLMESYKTAKTPEEQTQYMSEITTIRQSFTAYIEQFKMLMEDKLHELQKVKDNIEATLTLEKQAAQDEKTLAQEELKEAKEEQKETTQQIYQK